MSREIRRVPLDWKHPTQPNPYWREQASSPFGRSRPPSRLHGPTERFVPLYDDYPGSLASWQAEHDDLVARRGHSWTFQVEYHLTGFQGSEDTDPTVHPFYVWDDDDTERAITVTDEDHLHELVVAQHLTERPDPADYEPVWPEGTPLGWCLYETVSEGTPVTPTFATPEALVEHLCTIGEDWDQQPYRREAAQALVGAGSSMGSMVAVGGRLYDGARDLDVIPAARP